MSIHVVNIKDTMSTWARFLDLVEASKLGLTPHFDEAWIVTNARFTSHALKFAHCKNMVMIGWNHPKERTFANMVDLTTLYPITVIDDLKQDEIDLFMKQKISLCREVIGKDSAKLAKKIGVSKARMQDLQSQCEAILEL